MLCAGENSDVFNTLDEIFLVCMPVNLFGQKCFYLGLTTVLLNPDLSFFKKEKNSDKILLIRIHTVFHSDWKLVLTTGHGMLQVNRIKI